METIANDHQHQFPVEFQQLIERSLMNGNLCDDGVSTNQSELSLADNHDKFVRLKSYEIEIEKRQEMKEKRAKENAFLRTSLRESKELQKLESEHQRSSKSGDIGYGTPMQLKGDQSINDIGYSNDAYIITGDRQSKSFEAIPLEKVIQSVNRVADHLEKAEHRNKESKLLRNFFMQKPVQQAIEETIRYRKHQIDNENARCSHELGEERLVSSEMKGELKIVKLNKFSDAYLGATVRNEGDRIVIGRVIRGGIVEKSNLLSEGDELIEVNGQDIRGRNISNVCEILHSITGELSMVVVPNKQFICSFYELNNSIKHYRAMFDYDPEDDIYVPCKELALKFQRGDILHVINRSDDNWWQAYREGDDPCTSLAGLVPSISFQQKISMYLREFERESQRSKPEKRKDIFSCSRKKSLSKPREKKVCKASGPMDEVYDDSNDVEEILTYEEVSLYLSKTDRKRPLVLCGPEGVGCLELRQRLAELDSNKFASAVPHTTRTKKPNELNGVHYHFVSKKRFQDDAKSAFFIEYGEFQKNMYGTSKEAIQAVIDQSKICLLTLKVEHHDGTCYTAHAVMRVLKDAFVGTNNIEICGRRLALLFNARLKQNIRNENFRIK